MLAPTIIIMKPVMGCNLACKYCYMGYTKKTSIPVMSNALLKKVMTDIGALGLPKVEFNWHGGEPLLAGLKFFDRAIRLQKEYIHPITSVYNSLQTNGTIINMDWVNFLDDNSIGIGVSLDGPEDIQNFTRPFRNGLGSFSSVMKGVSCLFKSKGNNRHVHALPVISKNSLIHSDRIFSFFLDNGISNCAFTPCFPKRHGLPNTMNKYQGHISANEFADFMIAICNQWFRIDEEKIEVRFLSEITRMLLGGQSKLCIFQKSSCCAKFITIDAFGNVYPCDCYMSPHFILGNVAKMDLADILASSRRERFSQQVSKLPEECTDCRLFSICGGGCSYYRYFAHESFDRPNFYCSAIKRIVDSIDVTLKGGKPDGRANELPQEHSC